MLTQNEARAAVGAGNYDELKKMVEELVKKHGRTTPGEWTNISKYGEHSPTANVYHAEHEFAVAQCEAFKNCMNDAVFIAASRNALPAFCAALLAMMERAEAMEKDIKQACSTCTHSGKPSCPWEGSCHHRGDLGEQIGVCNGWQWRGPQQKGAGHEER